MEKQPFWRYVIIVLATAMLIIRALPGWGAHWALGPYPAAGGEPAAAQTVQISCGELDSRGWTVPITVWVEQEEGAEAVLMAADTEVPLQKEGYRLSATAQVSVFAGQVTPQIIWRQEEEERSQPLEEIDLTHYLLMDGRFSFSGTVSIHEETQHVIQDGTIELRLPAHREARLAAGRLVQTVNGVETVSQPLEKQVLSALDGGVSVLWQHETAEAAPAQVQLWCLLSDYNGLVYHYLAAEENCQADGRVERSAETGLVKITDEEGHILYTP